MRQRPCEFPGNRGIRPEILNYPHLYGEYVKTDASR